MCLRRVLSALYPALPTVRVCGYTLGAHPRYETRSTLAKGWSESNRIENLPLDDSDYAVNFLTQQAGWDESLSRSAES